MSIISVPFEASLNTEVASSQTIPLTQDSLTTESPSRWPLDTELVITPGTKNKVLLTAQRYMPRLVIHSAFEYLRASLLFVHAYPDQDLSANFIRDALITAAYARGQDASTLHKRLISDEDWVATAAPLVSRILCLERCYHSRV